MLTQRHLLLSPDPLRYTIGAGNSVTVYPDLDVLVDLRIGIRARAVTTELQRKVRIVIVRCIVRVRTVCSMNCLT